jgi:hypothetical protein
MADLVAELSEHFGSEEGDTHFGSITAEQPALLPVIAGLKTEHAALLAAARELCNLAAQRTRWPDLVAPARRFMAELSAHEHAETELLQEFVLRDDGTAQD